MSKHLNYTVEAWRGLMWHANARTDGQNGAVNVVAQIEH